MNIWFIILIGISLSMDTFSLALSMGTYERSIKKIVIYSLIVGTFHFILPLLGNLISFSIKNIITISTDKLLFWVFVFIAIEMFVDLLNKSEKRSCFSLLEMIICAFSVSIDSLTVGIGINISAYYSILMCLIFFILSTLFTVLGFKLGNYFKSKFGTLANILGLIIIIILAILQLKQSII